MSDTSRLLFVSFRNGNSQVSVEIDTKMNETKDHFIPHVIGYIRRSKNYLSEPEIVIYGYIYFGRSILDLR